MPKFLKLDDEFDIEVLRFLWTWKASTTAAIAIAINPNRKVFNVYRRLLELEEGNFIRTQASPNGNARVWLLDSRGFQTIQGRLPRLSENGYKSEHLYHDLLCHAIHLGDWIGQKDQASNLFTEQQLRRIDPEVYPRWVPNTPSHRPDGWWLINNGTENKLAALEVEVSLKDPDSYKSLGEFYSDSIQIDKIIWLVNGQSDAINIQRGLRPGMGNGSSGHNFIFLDDFFQHGWQSPIRIGKNVGQTLSAALCTENVPSMYQGTGMVLVDARKKPIKPRGSRSSLVSAFL